MRLFVPFVFRRAKSSFSSLFAVVAAYGPLSDSWVGPFRNARPQASAVP